MKYFIVSFHLTIFSSLINSIIIIRVRNIFLLEVCIKFYVGLNNLGLFYLALKYFPIVLVSTGDITLYVDYYL